MFWETSKLSEKELSTNKFINLFYKSYENSIQKFQILFSSLIIFNYYNLII